MRTTVDLDPHLIKRLRAAANREGVSFTTLLQRILRRSLEARPPVERAPYVVPTFPMGAPFRPLDKALAVAEAP